MSNVLIQGIGIAIDLPFGRRPLVPDELSFGERSGLQILELNPDGLQIHLSKGRAGMAGVLRQAKTLQEGRAGMAGGL